MTRDDSRLNEFIFHNAHGGDVGVTAGAGI